MLRQVELQAILDMLSYREPGAQGDEAEDGDFGCVLVQLEQTDLFDVIDAALERKVGLSQLISGILDSSCADEGLAYFCHKGLETEQACAIAAAVAEITKDEGYCDFRRYLVAGSKCAIAMRKVFAEADVFRMLLKDFKERLLSPDDILCLLSDADAYFNAEYARLACKKDFTRAFELLKRAARGWNNGGDECLRDRFAEENFVHRASNVCLGTLVRHLYGRLRGKKRVPDFPRESGECSLDFFNHEAPVIQTRIGRDGRLPAVSTKRHLNAGYYIAMRFCESTGETWRRRTFTIQPEGVMAIRMGEWWWKTTNKKRIEKRRALRNEALRGRDAGKQS